MDIQVGDIMKKKLLTVHPDATLLDVLRSMICCKSNAVLVVDGEGKLVGMADAFQIIREVLPDYVEDDAIAAHFATEDIFREDCEKAKSVPVEKFMTKDPTSILATGSIMEAAVKALTSKSERIPVVDAQGRPIGLLTRTEIKQVIGKYLGVAESFACSNCEEEKVEVKG